MFYHVETLSLDKLPIGPKGPIEPLCNTCCTPCSNPIKYETVSICGINRRWRLYVNKSFKNAVIQCRGYLSKDQELEELRSEEEEETDANL